MLFCRTTLNLSKEQWPCLLIHAFGALMRAVVVTSNQNHRINILFNIIGIFKKFKYYRIAKFSSKIDFEKTVILSIFKAGAGDLFFLIFV